MVDFTKKQNYLNYLSRREKELQSRKNKVRERQITDSLYPDFPTQQEYDFILVDFPHQYENHTQKSNIPPYNTLSFTQGTYLPIRRVAKPNSILGMWTTAPKLDQSIALMKIWGYRYITVFQNWIKLQNGKPAKIKSGYSFASSEFLLWGEKGRTKDLKTPDTANQVIKTEITRHSEKPSKEVFQNLIQKVHLNKMKCLEVFARGKNMKYFDVYGNELTPKFQPYDPKYNYDTCNVIETNNERVNKIMDKIKCNEQDKAFRQIIQKYPYAFALSKDEIGTTKIAQHHIRMKPNAVPARFNPYRLSPKELEFLEGELSLLESLGFIVRCAATWVMPVLMVKKKDTTDLRMCIDFRPLNEQMIIENYPIPRIDEILTLLGRYKVFSKLDIKSGFWHIEVHPDSQQYTGFITPIGTFQWRVMPFGLKNAPATFQRTIEQALQKVLRKTCIVYIDDIIIFSNNIQDHVKHVEEVISLLNHAQLRLGADKCEFFQTHIDILGHHISNNQITPQESKIQAIKNISEPENRSQVRSFVGMCSYYRSFIKDFSQKCAPLLKLTQQNTPFIWDKEVQQSFNQMKLELQTTPILQIPHPQGQYILQTDFSEKGLGAILNQLLPNETVPRVIEYASRSLRGAEINYPAYEGEVLAINWALQKFRHYLHGVHFKLYTDNKALQQVLMSTKISKKIIRWIMEMQEYNFTTEHRPGKDNANADALSRLFKIPDDITRKLSFCNSIISYQTYSYMPRVQAQKECNDSCHTILTEGVGNIPCKICQETHTKVPMIICECCGQGFHTTCLVPTLQHIPKEAWYCKTCLQTNENSEYKDITMDFLVLDYLQNKLDLSTISQSQLISIKQRAKYFQIIQNRLFYNKNTAPLLVPTIAERKLLVLEQHRILLHPSPQTLYNILSQNFYWSNMQQIIDEITYDCQVCQARKINNIPVSTYTPTQKGHHPFHTISIDLAPELVVTPSGNRHLLVVVDNFTKYTLLFPIKNKKAETIAQILFNNVFCTFGKPKFIRIDQGSEFKGEVTLLTQRWGIQLQKATTFHPQANGLVERQIQVIKKALTAAINDPELPLSWDEACYLIQMSINAAESRATKLSPFMVLFGRVMDIPQSIIYNISLEEYQEPTIFELKTYMKKFLSFLKTSHQLLLKNRQKVDQYNKQTYEKNNKKLPHKFEPNQLVFLKRGNTSRWSLPNIGPFIFLGFKNKSKQVTLLKNPSSGNVTEQHVSNLSPWKILQEQNDQF